MEQYALYRGGLLLLAVATLAWAGGLPGFHDSEGFLNAYYCLLISAITAAVLAALSWNRPYRIAAGWFALFLLGQGITLHFIDAGTRIHYQHSRLIHGVDTTFDAFLLGLLVIQAVLVGAGLRRYSGPVSTWISTHLGPARATVIAALTVVVATFPSRELHDFALELAINGALIGVQLACLILGILSLPPETATARGTRIDGLLNGPVRDKPGFDRLAIACAAWTVCIVILLSVYSYERHPHIADEVAYIFHANYFAEGRLGTPPPPVPEAVESYLIDCDAGPCVSPVPPGWPAVLALGSLAGVDWLVNPLLAGLNVLLIFRLLQSLYDRYTARLGVLLVAVTPWYLLMSMNFMTHTFSLTCALLAALSVVQMRQTNNSVWGMPGGIAIGLLSLTRPLEGLMVATVLGLAALFIPGKRVRLAPLLILGLVSMITGAIVLPYNQALTGDPMTFPIMAYADKVLGPGTNSLGFGPDKGVHWGGLDPFSGHGLPDVVVNAGLNLAGMNIELFGWSIGSLLPIILYLFMRPVRAIGTVDRWMLLFIVVIFAYQSLYWFSGGPDFGARYYYLAVVPLLALTVQSLKAIGHGKERYTSLPSRIPATVLVGVIVLSLSSLINFLPWRAIDKYHHYRGMRPDIRHLISETATGNDLLLISGEDHPDFNSAVVYTAIDPYGDRPVVAWDKNMEIRGKLLAAYPGRNVWLIDGPTLTGTGYRVTAGPVKATELMR